MLFSDRKLAGLLFFVAAVQCVIGISLAEETYPLYSVSQNYISDLGATCKSTCTIVEPSSIIFNTTVVLLGGLAITGAYLLFRSTRRQVLTTFLILGGIGGVGVGFFPETTGIVHAIMSLIVFLFGGLSAVLSYQVQEAPMNYLSIVLGAVTLAALGLYTAGIYAGLGPGGMERMIAYPALLWLVGFGAHLMKT